MAVMAWKEFAKTPRMLAIWVVLACAAGPRASAESVYATNLSTSQLQVIDTVTKGVTNLFTDAAAPRGLVFTDPNNIVYTTFAPGLLASISAHLGHTGIGPQSCTAEVGFTPGAIFGLSPDLGAGANTYTGSASANFADTATITGIEFLDANRHPIAGVEVLSLELCTRPEPAAYPSLLHCTRHSAARFFCS